MCLYLLKTRRESHQTPPRCCRARSQVDMRTRRTYSHHTGTIFTLRHRRETLNNSESTLATPALLSRITSHKTEHGSMHSSMARCSQSQPAAPTDEIDANGRTKRAASRVKGACAARTDQRRTTRRYPRPEHSRPRLRRPCGPPERGGVEASQNPGHRGRGSQAVRTARSRACVRQRAQSVQGTCKVRAAHTCKS